MSKLAGESVPDSKTVVFNLQICPAYQVIGEHHYTPQSIEGTLSSRWRQGLAVF